MESKRIPDFYAKLGKLTALIFHENESLRGACGFYLGKNIWDKLQEFINDNPCAQFSDFKFDSLIDADYFVVRCLENNFDICKGTAECVLSLCDCKLEKLVKNYFILNTANTDSDTFWPLDIMYLKE